MDYENKVEIYQLESGAWCKARHSYGVISYSFYETEDDARSNTNCYGTDRVYPYKYSC